MGDFFAELINYGQKCLASESNAGDAATFFEKAMKINPYDSNLHYFIGRTHELSKNFVRAKEHYREALRINPSNGPAKHALSDVIVTLAKSDDNFEASMREALLLQPSNQIAFDLLIEYLRKNKNIDKAIQELELALRNDPRNEELMLSLARCSSDKKRFYSAIHWCQQILDISPKSATAQTWLGHSLWEIGKKAEAFAAYETAVTLRPSMSMHIFLAKKYEDENNLSNALGHYDACLKLGFLPNASAKDKEMVLRVRDDLDTLMKKLNNASKAAAAAEEDLQKEKERAREREREREREKEKEKAESSSSSSPTVPAKLQEMD